MSSSSRARESVTTTRWRTQSADDASVLVPGRTCWRLERARRVALIVDARDYFAIAKAAIREARHAVMMIGWHFDLHIKLEPDRADATPPDELGRFLKAVAAQRPELRIHILQGDAALLATLARQIVPFLTLELIWHRRIHFRLDSDHPAGACHHQKIEVVGLHTKDLVGLLSIADEIDGVAELLQPAADGFRQILRVLDDEDPQRRPSGGA